MKKEAGAQTKFKSLAGLACFSLENVEEREVVVLHHLQYV